MDVNGDEKGDRVMHANSEPITKDGGDPMSSTPK